MKDEHFKELSWGFALITGHTCEICYKQILSPLRVDASSKIGTWHSFHVRCAKKFCKENNIEMCAEYKENTCKGESS